MMNIHTPVTVLLGLFLAGCSQAYIVNSTLLDKQKANNRSDHGAGTVYSLPKQLVKVTLTRAPLESSETAASVKRLKESVDSKKKEISTLSSEENALKKQISGLSGDNKAEAESKLNIELAIVQAKKLISNSELNSKITELNTATQEHTLALQSDGAHSEKLEITAEPITADSTLTYSANIQHSSMFSDNLELKSKNGLLDGALGHSEDKSADIFISIASSLAAMKSPGSNKMVYRSFRRQDGASKCVKSSVISVSQTIDPYDSKQLDIVNNLIQSACLKLSINNGGIAQTPSTAPVVANGLVYRTPGVLNFYVSEILDTAGKVSDTPVGIIPVTLAQAGYSGYIPMPKGRFAKNEYDVSFSNGILVKQKIVQPSEALGVAMIIPNTIKGVFALPTELVKFKVDYSSSEKSIAESQKAALAAQVEMEKLNMELEKLQQSN